MKRRLLFLKTSLFLFLLSIGSNIYATDYFVNNTFTSDDIYTTAAGNDANSGLLASLPKATLAAAISVASIGDRIFVDYGEYNEVGLTINKSLEIIGAGEEMTVFKRTSGIFRWGVISANNVKISKLTITQYNLASDGIAVSITSGTGIEFNRVTIYANVGSAGQGAVLVSGASTSATFKNSGGPCNRVGAANYGGAFKVVDATLVLDNCSINNNVISALYGGGVLITGNGSNVSINNTTFDNNQANSGGALAVIGSNCIVNVTGSCFNNNTATSSNTREGGGAVFLRPSVNSSTSSVNFSNCSFSGNTSLGGSSDGGAICFTNENSPTININIASCSFLNNSTSDDGNDLFFDKANSAIFNVTFKNNTFFTVHSGTRVNIYNEDLAASQIKFEDLGGGIGGNGDVVADGFGVSIEKPEMFGAHTKTSNAFPCTLPVTTCIDRFDGVCGAASVTIACVTQTIWNGSTWSKGSPTVFHHAILNADYNTLTHGNIDACQMTIRAGVTLDIVDGTHGTYVYVVNSIFNNGIINVKSKANLIQINHPLDLNGETIVTPNINFTKNTGNKIRWDYVYWSKPISSNVLSNYNSGNGFDLKYYWDPDFAIDEDRSYLGWLSLSIEPALGTGFITRIKTAIGETPTNFTLNYAGTSNNGNYTALVKYYNGNDNAFRNYSLLGNPYPGAIKFEDFYNDNKDKIFGTAYLWTAKTLYPGTGEYVDGDYATFNMSGGVTGATTQSPTGIDVPNGFIASAQGFMVRPKLNGSVVFKNQHRSKFIPSNNQFYRIAQNSEDKDRFWLRLSDESGKFKEQLIGYFPNATNNFDDAYDGPINSSSSIKFYSILESEKLIIQGKSSFVDSDKVSLGYSVPNNSTLLTISLANREGVFYTHPIYLYDKKLGFFHDLSKGNYMFKHDELSDRFEIMYRLNQNNEIISTDEIYVTATLNNGLLNIECNTKIAIIELFDITGKIILLNNSMNSNFFQKNISISKGVYILNVYFENGNKKSIKIIN